MPLRDLPTDRHPLPLAVYNMIDAALGATALCLEDLGLFEQAKAAEAASEAVGALWRSVQAAERAGR